MIEPNQPPTEDLDMARWCARITLAILAHPKREDALHFLFNHLVQRASDEDAWVLIQTALDCVMGEPSRAVPEASRKRLDPPRRHQIESMASALAHRQPEVSSTPLDTVEATLEVFRSATRLATTALSMAPKTPEAQAFACGLNAFIRQFKREASQASQVVVIALQFLQGEQPRQELERHVQAACKVFNDMRHDASARIEPNTKQGKP